MFRGKIKLATVNIRILDFAPTLVDDVWIRWRGYVQFKVRDSWECLCHLLLLRFCAICVHAHYSSVTGLREDFQSKSSLENCLKGSDSIQTHGCVSALRPVSTCCVLSFTCFSSYWSYLQYSHHYRWEMQNLQCFFNRPWHHFMQRQRNIPMLLKWELLTCDVTTSGFSLRWWKERGQQWFSCIFPSSCFLHTHHMTSVVDWASQGWLLVTVVHWLLCSNVGKCGE